MSVVEAFPRATPWSCRPQVYCSRPVTLAIPSLRGKECPTTEKSLFVIQSLPCHRNVSFESIPESNSMELPPSSCGGIACQGDRNLASRSPYPPWACTENAARVLASYCERAHRASKHVASITSGEVLPDKIELFPRFHSLLTPLPQKRIHCASASN